VYFSGCSDFAEIYTLHGSVATQLRRCEIFNNFIIANCPQNVPVKELLKSVDICQRYGHKFSVYLSRCL